jgi:hypothetical protein
MSKGSNVNPDHYKTAGRDRQDDAARSRQARAAKVFSQQRPDRLPKTPYRQRTEPVPEMLARGRATRSSTSAEAKKTASKASARQNAARSSKSPAHERPIKPSSGTRKGDIGIARTRRPTKKR